MAPAVMRGTRAVPASCDRPDFRPRTPGPKRLARGQRPVEPGAQVREQVLARLDADREPQQALVDAGAGARLWIHRGVRHRGRMCHQALDAAERLGEREVLEALDAGLDAREPTDHLEADHRAEGALLSRGDGVAWMIREPREVDLAHGRVRLEQS